MSRPFTTLAAVASIFAACGFAAAADLTIKNVRLGDVLHGPPATAEQLEGAVVFVEEWGIH
jgi:hypothetical protein